MNSNDNVVRHPTFGNPSVINPKRRGPKKGTISLNVERSRRVRTRARQEIEAHRNLPPSGTAPNPYEASLPRLMFGFLAHTLKTLNRSQCRHVEWKLCTALDEIRGAHAPERRAELYDLARDDLAGLILRLDADDRLTLIRQAQYYIDRKENPPTPPAA